MSAPIATAASPAANHAGQYLTVVIAHEAYGIAIHRVREIIRLQKITPVAQAPAFLKGVINLRGRVIPIVDLRVKFGLPAEFTERTCIVVVQIASAAERPIQMGLIVNAVEEVVNLSAESIEPIPEFGVVLDTSCLLGMAKINGQVKTILDIDQVVSPGTAARPFSSHHQL